MRQQPRHVYEFGVFHLDVVERRLLRSGEVVPLAPKVFDTLVVLVESGGHVVEKDDLVKALWPDTFVEESSLSKNISLLRKALGGAGSDRQYIETVAKRGYRFVADVREWRDDGPGVAPPRPGGRAAPGRQLLLALCGLILLAAAAALLVRERPGRAGARAPQSIAVIPFRPLGPERDNELLGLGMADALIGRLSKLGSPTVLPTSTVFKYTEGESDAVAVGRALGVEAVVSGTVQRAGDRVRVNAQLVSVADGAALWSRTFDEPFSDIFALQDAVSGQLAEALELTLRQEDRELPARPPTRNIEAYQSYLTGLYFLNRRTKDDIVRAAQHFAAAVERDPGYSLPHAGLAECYGLSAYYSYDLLPREEAVARAEAAARRAIELSPEMAEGYAAAALVCITRRDLDGAMREYRRALELNPNHAVARMRYANLLRTSLQLDEALREMKRAQQLDPTSALVNAALCHLLTLARRSDEAVDYGRRALELDPELPNVRHHLADAYLQKGMFEEALAQFRLLLERNGGLDSTYASLGFAYACAVAGREAEARKLLAPLLKAAGDDPVVYYNIALVWAALGERDKAFEWLGRGGVNSTVRVMLKYDSQLDPLRSDERFPAFLRRHGLEHLLTEAVP
jgi:DNA-binding winged helix-turn-helix (wHTH) protein/TolB-like protein/Flp pilus assembly protein TadD